MKKIKTIIVGLTVVFLMASMVYAQTQGESRQRGDGQRGRIFKELNLTQEQEKKLEENRGVQREELMKLRMAIKEKQTKLQEELKNPALTRATVEPLVSEIKSLQAQLIDHRISGIFAVKEILTPEQFAKFQQMTEKRQENRKERFQNRRERKKKTGYGQG
jgi:Spy/CpxP family protein refolding chaperone